MTLQHPYCRTCGSHVRSNDVCHHCGCEPLKGHNYCCDCGTSTVPEAIMCVHCGASFQKKFPATLAILISIVLAVSVAGAGYFMMHSNVEPVEKIANSNYTKNTIDSINTYKLSTRKKDEPVQIINNIPLEILNKKNDAITRLINNLPKNPKPETEVEIKTVTPPKNKAEATSPGEKTAPQKVSMNAFSAKEVRSYGAGCTYFEGRSKNNIVFFTTNIYGYVKINGKVFALQGVQKGNDVAIFRGAGYEVSIEILGLAGNENEWLAEATMAISDVRQRTLSRHNVYSACTDF